MVNVDQFSKDKYEKVSPQPGNISYIRASELRVKLRTFNLFLYSFVLN